jgi:hypothetical protein
MKANTLNQVLLSAILSTSLFTNWNASAGLKFDGTNDYVTFGAATNLNNLGVTDFTIECWFKRQGSGRRGNTGTGGFYAIPLVTKGMGENEAGRTNMNYFFGIGTNTAGQAILVADFEDFNNGLNHPVFGNGVVGSNVWVHGAATYDMAGSNWVLYLNGVPDATNLITGPTGITNYAMLLPRYDCVQHAALASCLLSTGTTNTSSGFFAGTMDEVRIWNYARSAQEIADSYRQPISSAPSLIARWSLNQTGGTVASNSIAGGAQGALTNGPVWTDGYLASLTVGLSYPTNGGTVIGDWMALTATATPSTEAAVTNVAFYADTLKIGEDATAPFALNWCAVAPATYSLTAVARDNSGAVATSSVVSVTVTGPAPTGSFGFDGTNDFVSFGPALELGVSTFTIECWFKRTGVGRATTTGTGGITNAIPLVTKGRGEAEASNVDMNWFLGISTNANVIAADFEEGAAGTSPGLNHPVFGNTALEEDIWYHAAATYDGTNWTLYLNGNVETNLAVGQPPRWDSIQHAALASALTSVGTPAGYFQGLLDEVRVWNYARSAAEIADNYQLQIATQPGLIALWALNEGSGAIARNALCGGINGTLTNGPAWSADHFASNTPPSVSITNPPSNTLFTNPPVLVEAAASDPGGFVTNIEFYADGARIGEDATAPYSANWSVTAEGQHTLLAVAADNGGAQGTSAVVTVTFAMGGAGGLYFDGNNDYVGFGPAPALGVTNFTIECWFKRLGNGKTTTTSGIGGLAAAIPLVAKGRGENDAGATNMNWFLGLDASGVLAADFEDNVNGGNHPVLGATPAASNQWQHAAVTYDGSNWVLYLNGVPDATLAVTGNTVPESGSIQHAALGSALTTAGVADGFFNGVLDEVRVWNYARSATQISNAMSQAIASASGLVARWSLDEGAGLVANNSGESGVHGILTNGPVWVAGHPFTVNRPPVAGADALTAYLNLAATVTVSQLLTNDTDPDHDPLDITEVSATSTNGGTVVLAPGHVTYTPVSGHLGSDQFTYTVADGQGGSATGVVLVQVQMPAAPALNAGSWSISSGYFSFSFSATPGVPYTIWAATNLAGPWQILTNCAADVSGQLIIEDQTTPLLPKRFYRAVFP